MWGVGESNTRHFECSPIDLKKKENDHPPWFQAFGDMAPAHLSSLISVHSPYSLPPSLLSFLKKAVSLASGPLHLLFFLLNASFYLFTQLTSIIHQSRVLAYHLFYQDAFCDLSVYIHRSLYFPMLMVTILYWNSFITLHNSA